MRAGVVPVGQLAAVRPQETLATHNTQRTTSQRRTHNTSPQSKKITPQRAQTLDDLCADDVLVLEGLSNPNRIVAASITPVAVKQVARLGQHFAPNPDRKHTRGRRAKNVVLVEDRHEKKMEEKERDKKREKYADTKKFRERGFKGKKQRDKSKLNTDCVRREEADMALIAGAFQPSRRRKLASTQDFARLQRMRTWTEIHDPKERLYASEFDVGKVCKAPAVKDGKAVLLKPSVWAIKRLIEGEVFKKKTMIKTSTIERALKSLCTRDKARLRSVIEQLLVIGNIEMHPGPSSDEKNATFHTKKNVFKPKVPFHTYLEAATCHLKHPKGNGKGKHDKGKAKRTQTDDDEEARMCEEAIANQEKRLASEDPCILPEDTESHAERRRRVRRERDEERRKSEALDKDGKEAEERRMVAAREDCADLCAQNSDTGSTKSSKSHKSSSSKTSCKSKSSSRSHHKDGDKSKDGNEGEDEEDPNVNNKPLDGYRPTKDEIHETMYRCFGTPMESIVITEGVYAYKGEDRVVTTRNVTEVQRDFVIVKVEGLCMRHGLNYVPYIAPLAEFLRSGRVSSMFFLLNYLRMLPFFMFCGYFFSIFSLYTFLYYLPLCFLIPYEPIIAFLTTSKWLWRTRAMYFIPQ